MAEEFLKNMKVIPAGKRAIVKSADRYLIWLPSNLNHVWERLNRAGLKVEVYLVVAGGEESEG